MAKKSKKRQQSAAGLSQAAIEVSIIDGFLQSLGLGAPRWSKYHDIARAHGISRPTLFMSLTDSEVHPIHMAADEGNIAAVNAMLDAGADIEVADECGFTALKYAARYDQPDTVRLLIARGADVHRSDKRGLTALHIGAESGSAACCEILIDAGANVHGKTRDNLVPLHFATVRNRADCCRLLVAHGAVINVRSNMGNTPLHIAAESNALETCRYLLGAGADVFATNDNGKTAVDLAPPNTNTKAFLDQAAQSRRLMGQQAMAPSRSVAAL